MSLTIKWLFHFRVIILGDHILILKVKIMQNSTIYYFLKRIYTQALRLPSPQLRQEGWKVRWGWADNASAGLWPTVFWKSPKLSFAPCTGEMGTCTQSPIVKIHCIWWQRPFQSFLCKAQILLCLSKATMEAMTQIYHLQFIICLSVFWELFKVTPVTGWHKRGRAPGLENFSLKARTKENIGQWLCQVLPLNGVVQIWSTEERQGFSHTHQRSAPG